MVRSITLLGLAASFLVFVPTTARGDTVPNAADLEIATLGDWLREAEPELAAQLMAEARKATGLSATQIIDWPIAQLGRALLTEDVLVSDELARADIVFVDGWLLARSEASAALLLSAAKVQLRSQSHAGVAG